MTISTSAIRKALRAKFGARNYTNTKDGEIHVFGQLPNSILTGWYVYGRIDSAETMARLAY